MRRIIATIVLATALTACGTGTSRVTTSVQPRPVQLAAPLAVSIASEKPEPKAQKFTPQQVFAILYYTNKPFRQAFQRMFVIPYDYGTWWQVAVCEEGGRLHSHGRFGNGLMSAGTGLGFSVDAWHMAQTAARERGVDLPWGGAADWHEQMTGAQAFMEKHGGGPDCL